MSFFLNTPATTEIYTLSLHDALPISTPVLSVRSPNMDDIVVDSQSKSRPSGFVVFQFISALNTGLNNGTVRPTRRPRSPFRSEEHTSELQSQSNLVCRLLLEKKKHTH